jgi:hypothetical protein
VLVEHHAQDVYPQPGRGGGWWLVGGARTVPGEAKAALRKLDRALPATFRAGAEASAGATMIHPTRWGERDRTRPPRVDLLQESVVSALPPDETFERPEDFELKEAWAEVVGEVEERRSQPGRCC